MYLAIVTAHVLLHRDNHGGPFSPDFRAQRRVGCGVQLPQQKESAIGGTVADFVGIRAKPRVDERNSVDEEFPGRADDALARFLARSRPAGGIFVMFSSR